jgi:D-sedoheptulose 7-phosphate isomerase
MTWQEETSIAKLVFEEHSRIMIEAAASLSPTIERVAESIFACIHVGNKVLALGNGGSASDSEHLVAELVGRFRDERRALPAVSLTSGAPTITAIANDYGFEKVFSRQVEAIARPGDMLFAISTSGNSLNVLAAVQAARERGCIVVGLTGEDGGRLAGQANIILAAPSRVTARIQEVHIVCIHIICQLVDGLITADESR